MIRPKLLGKVQSSAELPDDGANEHVGESFGSEARTGLWLMVQSSQPRRYLLAHLLSLTRS